MKLIGIVAYYSFCFRDTVIKGFARIGYAAKADNLLWELQTLSTKEGRRGLDPPDAITIAACINAWSRGHVTDIDKALDRSTRLLDLIIDTYRGGRVQVYQKDVEIWIFEEVIRVR